MRVYPPVSDRSSLNFGLTTEDCIALRAWSTSGTFEPLPRPIPRSPHFFPRKPQLLPSAKAPSAKALVIASLLEDTVDHQSQRLTLLAKNRDMIARKRKACRAPGKQLLPPKTLVQHAHALVEIHEVGSKDNPTAVQRRRRTIFSFYFGVQSGQQTPR
jgi:hypothetical protein